MGSGESDFASKAVANFNALRTIEGLLEGVVAFVVSLLWCLLVLPLLFCTRRPFHAVAQALAQSKPLPPLLFNFVGTIPVLVYIQFNGRLIDAIDRRGELAAAWRLLSAEDTGQFLFVAGPPIAAIWMFVALSSRILARVTLQPIELLRVFWLYFVGLLANYFSIGIFLLMEGVHSPGGRVSMLPPWLIELGLGYFTRAAPLVLLLALVLHVWREIRAKYQGASGTKNLAVTVLVCSSIFGVAAAADVMCLAAWSLMEGVRSDLTKEHETRDPKVRGALSLDAQRCNADRESLKCIVLMHSFLSHDVQLVDVESASLTASRLSVTGRPLQTFTSPVSGVSLKPAIDEGDALTLTAGQQAHLNIKLPQQALCAFADPDIPGEAYLLKIVFVGVIKDPSKAQGLEVLRPIGVPLNAVLVRSLRSQCATRGRIE